jgi:hypothetical protein
LSNKRHPKPPVAIKGDVSFAASPTASNYQVVIFAGGTSDPVVASQNVGTPAPTNGTITVHLASVFNALAAGNYHLMVATTLPTGITVSGMSNEFTVPLV